MRDFQCDCGQTLYFENTVCTACQRRLGYEPLRAQMLTLEPVAGEDGSGQWWRDTRSGEQFRRCFNDTEYQVCNWLVSNPGHSFCLACSLNDTIPEMDSGYRALQRRQWWGRLEQAKRRLLYTLLYLGLPVSRKTEQHAGLAFSFLEDQRSNPFVDEEHVLTGHLDGLITVNLAEADVVNREQTRQNLGEPYRTLLGHFRHESGHYYFNYLLTSEQDLLQFRAVFGDERSDYQAAVQRYYREPGSVPQGDRISAYAALHPLEDWAECWAHYLHMMDCLETAAQVGLLPEPLMTASSPPDIEKCLTAWLQVSVAMNALNRSMGLRDAYPFVLTAATLNKLRFVHQRIYPSSMPRQTVASV